MTTKSKNKFVTLRLIFDVKIKLDGTPIEAIRENLEAIPIDAMDWGNVTGETAATVEGHRIFVEDIAQK